MKYDFRSYRIRRSCNKKYSQYSRYKKWLKKDFHARCAYCNLRDDRITTPFEIDHFIPRDAFKTVRPELDCLYDNLMYTCKKCNNAKSGHYDGDIYEGSITNNYFYNPVETDYNEIFYRNEMGSICSEDAKGLSMIARLKLNRCIHNLAWICDRLDEVLTKLEAKLKDAPEGSTQREEYLKAQSQLLKYYHDCNNIFIAKYNDKDF